MLENARSNTIQQHHAYDLIFGMIIGIVLGTLAYRSAYAAVFDFRHNHIPLPPSAIKAHYSHCVGCRKGKQARFEGDQGAEDDALDFWSWWKHTCMKIEEKKGDMTWLQSIKSVQVTGRDLESETNSRLRKYSREAMFTGQEDKRE